MLDFLAAAWADHPFWFCIALWWALFFAYAIANIPFKIVNRIVRGASIRKNGWPPAHCDADGDIKSVT
ncbi:hypothetical protein BAJUN_00740 [Bajunvirus bajun]|uniref:Uncharacterized protein n=1 Tax=Brevundimonas phage vB_BgoS-Bajun TaxID=2948594 RepID=A0A9E7SRX5_9CAUD|nr:hypothetical protein BAJUN_00740 [Brevundimonas phage vB_BgoS-Bajun]